MGFVHTFRWSLRLAAVTLLAVILFFPSLFNPSYAADEVQASTYVAKNDVNISAIVSEANNTLDNSATILEYDAKEGIVSFDFRSYNTLSSDDKTEFMQAALTATTKSGLGQQRKSKLYNFIAEQDGAVAAAVSRFKQNASGDFYTAFSYLRPFAGGFSTILGIGALIVFMLMSLSIFADLAYISLPMLQSSKLTPGEGIAGRLISRPAGNAVKHEIETGKNPVTYWLTHRFIVLLVLSAALMYLVTGTIYDIMGVLLSSVGIV